MGNLSLVWTEWVPIWPEDYIIEKFNNYYFYNYFYNYDYYFYHDDNFDFNYDNNNYYDVFNY